MTLVVLLQKSGTTRVKIICRS